MKPRDFEAFVGVLEPTAIGFGEPSFPADRVKYYFAALAAYDVDTVTSAILATANQPGRVFFPRPGEIIATIEGDPETRAALAWERVCRAMHHVGSDAPITFDDPALHAAIELLGGWEVVGMWSVTHEIDELGFKGVEFRRLYKHYLAHPPAEAPAVLNAHMLGVRSESWPGYELRRIDGKGLPAPLGVKALPAGVEQPKFDPVGAAAALEAMTAEVGLAMSRRAVDPARGAAARALGPGDKQLDVEPTEAERVEHERRRQAAREQAARL